MKRKNFDVLRSKCKLICNTCYPDDDVLNATLLDNEIDPETSYQSSDVAKITRCAILIVLGWCETSRSEGGISTAVDQAKVQKNIKFWCGQCGLDASEFVSLSTIDNGSNLW